MPDSQPNLAAPPSEVQVTVFRLSDDGAIYRRLERQLDRIPAWASRVVLATLLAAALAGLGMAIALGGGGPRGAVWGVSDAGPAGVAAAYGYPLGCLRVRISAANPALARAEFDHHGSCGYVSGFPVARFRRFGGEWHPVLYSASSP